MSVKFTKTGQGSEANDESLLFEFLDHELPEKIELDYESDLVTTKYVGSLQSSQHNGIFLQPIDFEGEFHGDMVDKDGNLITAKERFDQLARLEGRVVKFWVEGIKQIVIIKKLKMTMENYASIKYHITLQPHDLQIAIAPTKTEMFKQQAFILAETNVAPINPLQKNIGEPDLNNHDLGNALPIPILEENHIDNFSKKGDIINKEINNFALDYNRVDMKQKVDAIRVYGANGSHQYLSRKSALKLEKAYEGLSKSIEENRKLNTVEQDANDLANKSVKRFGVQR